MAVQHKTLKNGESHPIGYIGPRAGFPLATAVDDGVAGFDPATGHLYLSDGTNWIQFMRVPSGIAIGDLLTYNGTAITLLTPGAEAKVLTAHGAGAALTWETAEGGAGGPHAASHAVAGDDAVTLAQSQITGLETALGGKAESSHSHAQSDVTNLTTDLSGKAASSHTHGQSDVTNLTTDLAGKAASSHTHGQSDVTDLVTDLAGKAASSHTHAQADVTNLTTDLGAKAPSASPTFTGAVAGPKFKLTEEGGLAISMTAGEDLTAGQIVAASGSADDTVVKATASSEVPLGVVYANALNGAAVWVVVSGIAAVKFATGVSPARGDYVYVSSTAGEAAKSATGKTWRQLTDRGFFAGFGLGENLIPGKIGHCIQSGSSGSSARCVLQFN